MISGVWCKVVFSIFLEFFIFFVLLWPEKIREPFFLSKSKVQKSKNVYIYYFYEILKIFKSQDHKKLAKL